MTPLVDQRSHRRIAVETTAEIKVGSGLLGFFKGWKRIPCTVKDVSICGVQLHSEQAIPEQSGLTLVIHLPIATGTETFRLRGDVRWSANEAPAGVFAVGVRLRDKPAGLMRMWKEIVRERIREHFSDYVPAPAIQ